MKFKKHLGLVAVWITAQLSSFVFIAGLGLIAASAFTVSLTLGLLVAGLLLTVAAVFWERGNQ